MRVRSMVGLTPLFAVSTLEPDTVERFPAFWKRARWFLQNRPELAEHCPLMEVPGRQGAAAACRSSTSTSSRASWRGCSTRRSSCRRYGVRSLSRGARRGTRTSCASTGRRSASTTSPRESRTGLFGGNSNWRGPVWMPVNYLVIEALQRLATTTASRCKVECPTGSGKYMHAVGGRRASSRAGSSASSRPGRDGPPPGARPPPTPSQQRPALPRPRHVLRVLPRRHRRGPRRARADRLDRARRQAARAEPPLAQLTRRRPGHPSWNPARQQGGRPERCGLGRAVVGATRPGANDRGRGLCRRLATPSLTLGVLWSASVPRRLHAGAVHLEDVARAAARAPPWGPRRPRGGRGPCTAPRR